MKSERDVQLNFLRQSSTAVTVQPPSWRIFPESRFFFSGSCFAESLYKSLRAVGMRAEMDPFGPIYNPLSLNSCLKRLLSDVPVSGDELFEHEGLWRHPLFSTKMTGRNRDDLAERLSSVCTEARTAFLSADHAVFTLGTAWCWRDRETGFVVNNCHKLPESRFDRFCMTPDEAAGTLQSLVSVIKTANPRLAITVSLSPVRHLRDNPAANSLSKAVLRWGLESLAELDVWYFPAYEIMMDELRDYRWYGPDLVHPSEAAVEYILERFFAAAGSPDLPAYLSDVRKLTSDFNHRVTDPDSPASVRFLESRDERLNGVLSRFPALTESFNQLFSPKK